MVTGLAIAGSLAGWLILVRMATGGPRLGRAVSRSGAVPMPPTESPAVMGLVAGRKDADLFTVTLLDLAARGWFRLIRSLPNPGAVVPAMCVLPAEAPVEELTPYEQRAVAHLSRRAGPLPEIPAAALADGFEGGADPFRQAFRGDVVAAARRLGLTRPTLSTARKAVLCLFALVPAGVALGAAYSYQHNNGQLFVFCAFYYVILCTSAVRVSSERLTPKGRQALADWQAHSILPGAAAMGTRDEARAAALGASPESLAQFTAPGDDTAWSGYGGGWRLVTIGDPDARTWPGLSGGALAAFCLLTTPGIPLLAFLGYEVAGGSRGIELGILTGVALDTWVITRGVSRWAHLPRFAEFDGMVLRQWEVDASDEGTSYYVAVDDGLSPRAWAFEVRGPDYQRLAPGALAHVRINARLNKLIDIEVTRPPARSPRIADPAQPADPP